MLPGLARHLKKAVKRHNKAKAKERNALIAGGLIKGPLQLRHESGACKRGPWRDCPVCVIAYIQYTNTRRPQP